MHKRRFAQGGLRMISVDTVALVNMFEAGRYDLALLRAGSIMAEAQRAGLPLIYAAARVVEVSLAKVQARPLSAVDTGLTLLVEAVERASLAPDRGDVGTDP